MLFVFVYKNSSRRTEKENKRPGGEPVQKVDLAEI
jgi:hypothetical protein